MLNSKPITMYIILLKTPIEGKMQVETKVAKLDTNGIWIYPGKTWEDNPSGWVDTSNIDSIIVKPE